MTGRVGTTLGIAAALFTLCAAGGGAVTPPGAAPIPASHRPTPAATHHPATCATPAPTTAAGYTALFNALPSKQWGAADGAETVALPDGRSLWLFGDTFSDDRFVHSTAITQDRGCLHVSHAGAQLLPNDPNGDIYWIDHATTAAGQVTVIAERMSLTGSCTFCFHDTGVTVAAAVTVSAAGDATFVRWIGPARKIAPAVTLTYPRGALDVHYRARTLLRLHSVAHEWIYSPWLHPELRLASGKTLLSMGHNWDDGRPGLENYRPLFFEVTR